MPSRSNKKLACVFYALVFWGASQAVTVAQNYPQHGSTVRQSFSGMVEQLSRGDDERLVPAGHAGDRDNSTASAQAAFSESGLRVVDNGAVTLRPTPMTVRRSSYEAAPLDADFSPRAEVSERQALARLQAEEHLQSFIEREAAAEPPAEKVNPSKLITRIGVNLMFVLALAIGGILLVKFLQKGKLHAAGKAPDGLQGLKIDQVLEVSRGVSLYLIDSSNAKVLVAVDGGGIKSVNVLPGRFEDALEEPAAFGGVEEPAPAAPTRAPTSRKERIEASRRRLDQTSSSEIDQNLIKLLLNQSKQAA